MLNGTEETRRSYKPETVKVLLIGESPPAGKTFFYNADSKLFRYTKLAFSKALNRDVPEGENFLKYLQDEGFYLDDLSLEPINKLSPEIRSNKRESAELSLAERIAEYKPQAIILVMKGIRRNVKNALRFAEVNIGNNYYEVPFPAYNNQNVYINMLSSVLNNLHNRKMVYLQ